MGKQKGRNFLLYYIELNGGRVLGFEILWRSDASTDNFSVMFIAVMEWIYVVVFGLKFSRRGS